MVLQRSYSRNSGRMRCDADTGTPRRCAAFGNGGLVRRVGVGVQQADGQRLRAGAPHLLDDPVDFGRRQGLQHLAVVGQAFGDPEPQAPRHQRRQLLDERVVQVRARLAPDFQNVLETPRGHQRRARALAFQQRIGRHRGAVHQLGTIEVRAQVRQPPQNRARRIFGGRQNLVDDRGAVVDANEIAERAAGVHTDMKGHLFSLRPVVMGALPCRFFDTPRASLLYCAFPHRRIFSYGKSSPVSGEAQSPEQDAQ